MNVLGSVNLQLQGPFVTISLWSVLRIVQLTSWLQSSHYGVLLLGGVFSTYKTAHRIWLRVLSIALEKKLKVLDYAS